MNEQPTFKAGGEVYCPRINLIVNTLSWYDESDLPFEIQGSFFSRNGFYEVDDATPSIFHATPENKALLEALYKCEFESPKLKGSDLTRKLLSEGKHVLCYVSDQSEDLAVSQKFAVLVTACVNSTHPFYGTAGYKKYAVPCNDYANLVDGALELKGDKQ